MVTLKKYDLTGQESGEVNIDDALLDVSVSHQMVKEYIVAIRANARQWSANTKGRSEVRRSRKKPHKQKGTGKARQGGLTGPHFKGGGVAFGPKPKFDQHIRINKRERRAVLRFMIAELMREGRVHVLSDDLGVPKTKVLSNFLSQLGIEKRALFMDQGVSKEVVEGEGVFVDAKSTGHKNLLLSVRNIPKVEFTLAKTVNGYDLAKAADVVMTEGALEEVKQWLL